MILIIGRMARHESLFQESLYNLCAELCRQSLLTGCLIVYPPEPAERAWIPSFIHSLRSAGIPRVNLLISTSVFSPEDLQEIEGMGVYEIIFSEESERVHFINTPRIGIRVWLKEVHDGGNHRKMCRWNVFVKNLLSIERAPIAFSDIDRPQILVWKEAGLPASYSLPEPWSSRLPLRIIGEMGGREAWTEASSRGTLTGTGGRGAWTEASSREALTEAIGREALIEPPSWLFMPDKVPDDHPADRRYFDFVKDDLLKMTERKQLTLREDFLYRIQQNAQTYFS